MKNGVSEISEEECQVQGSWVAGIQQLITDTSKATIFNKNLALFIIYLE